MRLSPLLLRLLTNDLAFALQLPMLIFQMHVELRYCFESLTAYVAFSVQGSIHVYNSFFLFRSLYLRMFASNMASFGNDAVLHKNPYNDRRGTSFAA
jgi:hypothetical protein